MIWVLWVALAALATLALSLVLARHTKIGDPFVLSGLISALLTLAVCGLLAVIVLPSRSVGRTTCRHWAAASGYPTKFTILNWSDTGTCLAQTPNGQWVRNTQIIINVPDSR